MATILGGTWKRNLNWEFGDQICHEDSLHTNQSDEGRNIALSFKENLIDHSKPQEMKINKEIIRNINEEHLNGLSEDQYLSLFIKYLETVPILRHSIRLCCEVVEYFDPVQTPIIVF